MREAGPEQKKNHQLHANPACGAIHCQRFTMPVAPVIGMGILAAVLALAPADATAYPERPIRFIVASAPGGGPDILARITASHLSQRWGQTVVVDNRPGAGGNLGAGLGAQAAADGYTLVMISASQAIGVTLYKKLPYSLKRDLTPVTQIASTAFVLLVPSSLPVQSVPELIALAKSRPGALNFGSGGSGTPPHLAYQMFKTDAGIDVVHIPYRSIATVINALLAGTLQLTFAVAPVSLPHLRAGRVRALAVTSKSRIEQLSGVPAVAEYLPDFEVVGWWGLTFPAGTPKPIVDKLYKEVRSIADTPELKKFFNSQGAVPVVNSPEEFRRVINMEITKWGRAVKDSGAQVD